MAGRHEVPYDFKETVDSTFSRIRIDDGTLGFLYHFSVKVSLNCSSIFSLSYNLSRHSRRTLKNCIEEIQTGKMCYIKPDSVFKELKITLLNSRVRGLNSKSIIFVLVETPTYKLRLVMSFQNIIYFI